MADQMADLVVCADPSAPCCPASPGVDQIPGVDAGSQQEIAVALRRHKQREYTKAWRAKRKAQNPESIEQIESRRRKQREADKRWSAKQKAQIPKSIEHIESHRHKQREYMKAWRAKRKELTEGSVVAPSPQLAVAMGQPCVPSAQGKGDLGPPRALTGMATPQDGDRILVFRPRWVNLLLDKDKDLEIRGRHLSSGPCWLGCRGTIYGHCFLGSPIVIDSIEAWRGLRHRHRVEVDELPYKTTYGFPVHQCRRVTLTSYEHPRGAVGIVRFRSASSRHKGQRPPSGGASALHARDNRDFRFVLKLQACRHKLSGL